MPNGLTSVETGRSRCHRVKATRSLIALSQSHTSPSTVDTILWQNSVACGTACNTSEKLGVEVSRNNWLIHNRTGRQLSQRQFMYRYCLVNDRCTRVPLIKLSCCIAVTDRILFTVLGLFCIVLQPQFQSVLVTKIWSHTKEVVWPP